MCVSSSIEINMIGVVVILWEMVYLQPTPVLGN